VVNMKIEFKEKQTLGGGWSLEVWKVSAIIGHIRKHGYSGGDSYFHGPNNVSTTSIEDEDLEALKRKVSARYQYY
jgi:hypothetical protein